MKYPPAHAGLRRRWLAYLLLVLYVAAVHGLPALHLFRHQSDHVHVLGSLRWLRARLPTHLHGPAALHHAPAESPHAEGLIAEYRPQPRLRACNAPSFDGFGLHLAMGPAHGQQSLLAPATTPTLAAVAPTLAVLPFVLIPSAREFAAKPRARAPPETV